MSNSNWQSMIFNACLLTDGYKTGHHQQYPKGITKVYSNLTGRSFKYSPIPTDYIVCFGSQLMVRGLYQLFKENFFDQPKESICGELKRELSLYLNADYDVTHFEKLHDLGYLPIVIKSLPEGTLVPEKIPIITLYNTHDDFAWVTNFLETIISNIIWKPLTSATIAFQYRCILHKWAEATDIHNIEFVKWQAHDFSMRGMSSIDTTISSGLGHLTSFYGTDSLPSIIGARKYYDAEGFVGGSVNATEHSVMSAGGQENELQTFDRLLDTYPNGILSIVSDTWDLTKIVAPFSGGILYDLKEKILSREGKLVIRPDSGNPLDILCGNGVYSLDGIKEKQRESFYTDFYSKGLIQCLWDIFGGTVNDQGYKVLNSKIGAIYGDSITVDLADKICAKLEKQGFATTNVVFGIGSYTYQMNTRDTFGTAMKATYCEIDGVGYEMFKDPITDNGVKKSAKGLLRVRLIQNKFMDIIDPKDIVLDDQVSWEEEGQGELREIFRNGEFLNQVSLSDIRDALNGSRMVHNFYDIINNVESSYYSNTTIVVDLVSDKIYTATFSHIDSMYYDVWANVKWADNNNEYHTSQHTQYNVKSCYDGVYIFSNKDKAITYFSNKLLFNDNKEEIAKYTKALEMLNNFCYPLNIVNPSAKSN